MAPHVVQDATPAPETGHLAIHDKAGILSAVRQAAVNHCDSESHRRRLKEMAGLLPDFPALRQLCIEDMLAAYHEDRKIGADCKARRQKRSGIRITASRKLIWERLFEHFASRVGLSWARIDIRSIGRSGLYAVELAEKDEKESEFDKALRILEEHGVAKAKTEALYLSEQMQAAVAVRCAGAAQNATDNLLCDKNLSVLGRIAQSGSEAASHAKEILAAFQRADQDAVDDAASDVIKSAAPQQADPTPHAVDACKLDDGQISGPVTPPAPGAGALVMGSRIRAVPAMSRARITLRPNADFAACGPEFSQQTFTNLIHPKHEITRHRLTNLVDPVQQISQQLFTNSAGCSSETVAI